MSGRGEASAEPQALVHRSTPDLERAIAILADLVAFESISDRSNLDIAGYIADRLRRDGVAAQILLHPGGQKAAVFATVGPGDRPGIVLSAHTDVVPVEGQRWTSPPFQATQRDGRIHGRGTTHMKGFLAAVLAAVPVFRATASVPVHLAFSEPDRREVAFVRALSGSGEPAGTVAFGTEAGIFARAGIPTLVCGPGDMVRAHKADEWIGIDAMAHAGAMLDRLAHALARPSDPGEPFPLDQQAG